MKKLKAGTVYYYKTSDRLGVLERSCYSKCWQLNMGNSVLPASLNPNFRTILRKSCVYIGEL